MKLGTFFSGIGATEKALKNIGVEYDLQFFSEVDKYAIKSYVEIHNEPITKNVGDITKLKGKDLPYCDMWFGGFPCQDISIAGNLAGWESNTRSSLGWEMIRLAREVEEKPKYIIFENVKNITSKRFKDTLRLFKSDLEELGYYLYDKVLNAKDYGIPQNRERYFLIASLEDIDYKFPKKEELKLTLKDMLENEVDEKFCLKEEQIERMLTTTYNSAKYETRVQKEIANTLLARYYKDPKLIEVFDYRYDVGVRTRVDKGISPSITTRTGNAGFSNNPMFRDGKRIRKLTPKECFRLMGFDDEDFEKTQTVNSNTQLYKQAGNSIVVDVLEKIFKELFRK